MNKFENWYLETTKEILNHGDKIVDRTGTGTLNIFNATYTHNLLEEPFPILSCRKFNYKAPIIEMIGFMRGITNSEWFNERGCKYWNGFGLPADVKKAVRKEDHELAHEYCSLDGLYKPTDSEYQKRYKELNELNYDDGIKLITDSGIKLYKEILIGKKGDLGPIYGHMWRNWPNNDGTTFDQLIYAYNELLERPQNRRIVINGWNPSYLPDFYKKPSDNVLDGNMSLTPCHVLHEYSTSPIPLNERIKLLSTYCSNILEWETFTNSKHTDEELMNKLDDLDIPKYYLDLCWFQRSWDFMLGAPANIIGYTSMLMMMAKCVNMIPRKVSVMGINVHIYNNHIEGANELLKRANDNIIPLCKPELIINNKVDFIDQYEVDDFDLINYECLSHINFPISF